MLTDTNISGSKHKNIYYLCIMEKNQTQSLPEQGLEYWENEALYFEKAKEGLTAAFAIVSHMHEVSKTKILELTPEREEVL